MIYLLMIKINRELNKILKDLLAYYNGDKIKLVRFCLEKGHLKQDIANALDVSPSAVTKFIKRHNLEDK